MVLQNKYKARASRRYNNSKASTDNAEPGSSKPGYRNTFANKHRTTNTSQAPQSESDSEDDDGDDGSISGSGSDDGDEGNTEFPSLSQAAATCSSSIAHAQEHDNPSNPSKGKYARRRLGESKLARLERLEAAKDPRLPDEEEPEPEVDISALVARVAALGDSNRTQAGIAEEISRSRAKDETASDVENDIDRSLAYLHEKERQRQRARGHGSAAMQSPDETRKVTHEEAVGSDIDLEALQKEKEKAEAVRALKARFQGHGVGERSRADAKPRPVPSIHIGPTNTYLSSKSAPPDGPAVPCTGTLSDSLALEIESSLAKSRNSANDAETASTHSGRSSFSTTFGRRKSPLAGAAGTAEPARKSPGGGGGDRTERIDSFLASLNDRSVNGRDLSVFSLSPVGVNGGNNRQNGQQGHRNSNGMATYPTHQQQAIRSNPGELGRLENFLDDMLG